MKRIVWACTTCVCAALIHTGCTAAQRDHTPVPNASTPFTPPAPLRPQSANDDAPTRDARTPQATIDLTDPGAVVWGTSNAVLIDTTAFDPQTQLNVVADTRRVKEILPPHKRHAALPAGAPNNLPLGGSLAAPRAIAGPRFPGITQTGWVPPDPTLAVGPTHIVTTVNQAIAFLARDGTVEFSVPLNDTGSPGFFEPVGAGGFTFDPKCFYDHDANRFVVLALEAYDTTEAWVTIAVSDDSNPHGVWYRYRTDAVITVGATTFWWDYPGFGYDADAYYVTANLFGLNQSGWGGVGFRIFNKAEMLVGDPVVFSTLRDGGAASVQAVQHFGANAAPFFVSTASTSALRIHAITNPTTAPALTSRTVAVPAFSDPIAAPAAGGNTINAIDSRMLNAHWRDGRLYAAHTISQAGRDFARWYHVNTRNWPTSGSPILKQSGNIDAGTDQHTWFPAIYSNALRQVAIVFGSSSATDRISVKVTARLPSDPLGSTGALTQLKLANVDGGGRWGDYYDIAIDPVDDDRFWIIGEYPVSFGWSTWIGSFTVIEPNAPTAVDDAIGTIFSPNSVTVDVLANDVHASGLSFAISAFDAVSAAGGTVAASPGTGPGGRDELTYTTPAGYTGPDSFNYTITDTNNVSDMAIVSASVYDPTTFRDPDNPAPTIAGVEVSYYVLASPTALPDFSTLTPDTADVVPNLNYAASAASFATSGLSDNLGAVFAGYVNVPATDLYTFYTESDDGSRLYIGNTLVVDNDGLHAMSEVSGQIGLKAGTHAIRIEFFEAGGDAGLIARFQSGSLSKRIIMPARWSHDSCPADVDEDGNVDLGDLALILANFGTPSGAAVTDGDVSGDGDVDLEDLALVLAAFGQSCP